MDTSYLGAAPSGGDMDASGSDPSWNPQAGEGVPVPIPGDEPGRKMLDLVFLLDATGSMGSYIASALRNIESIAQQIIAYEGLERLEDLRMAIVSYRDHPPQDRTYVTKTLPFTSSIQALKDELASLTASGGGDGPEAATAAMAVALRDLQWRNHGAKMCVLITDAPPHGIGEIGDGFPDGDPDGHDPISLAREMASRGITFFVVACEPNLSSYRNCVEFYQALCNITSGLMLPLTTADVLAHAIVGSVLENFDVERIVTNFGAEIANRMGGDADNIDAVAQELHERLLLMGQTTKKVQYERIYNETPEFKHNVKAWSEAVNLADGRSRIVPFKGHRYTEAYQKSKLNHGVGSYYSYSSYPRPMLPPRPISSRIASPTPSKPTFDSAPAKPPPPVKSRHKPSTAFGYGDDSDSSLTDIGDDSDDMMSDDSDDGGRGAKGRGTSAMKGASGSPEPVRDFKAFTMPASSFPSSSGKIGVPDDKEVKTKAMFTAGRFGGSSSSSGMRGRPVDSDDEDVDIDEDEDGEGRMGRSAKPRPPGHQEIGLQEDAISLEQAKRIAQQSIWRMRA